MLVNLTRCMRYLDDLSVTQMLVRRMGQSQERQTSRVVCVGLLFRSEDCAKHVRV